MTTLAVGEEPSTSGGGGGGAGGVSPLGAAEVDKVLAILFAHSGSDEEGVRNVVAECLGRVGTLFTTVFCSRQTTT